MPGKWSRAVEGHVVADMAGELWGEGVVGSVSFAVKLARWRRSATRRDRADVGAAAADMRRTAGRGEHNRREGKGAGSIRSKQGRDGLGRMASEEEIAQEK